MPGAPPKAPAGGCPAIWFQISKDLTGEFSDGGQCNDFARGAIRAVFHDCGAWKKSLGNNNNAGCDGSLFLAKEELSRPENAGLTDIVPKLGALAQKYNVGVADFIQFAGAHAVKTCPLGPIVRIGVGRKDSSVANPPNLLPNPKASGDSIFQNFQDKGFSAVELAALIGAHTSAKQFVQDPSKAGTPLDTTPGTWDVAFYGQVLDKSAPFILASDQALSQQAQVGPAFKAFVNQQAGWNAAFAPAMNKLGLSGVDPASLVDCTAALPGGGPRKYMARRQEEGLLR
ncbi:heme peroxidase [Trichodelitschia bisporula]|uniref:Peroxidase n=1 Tax=Trichodelitschia bisporula TaxID=703511 RepID=A0A6G1I6Z1_9PEZI|nr:heme peroxidase [Trichodelitschia bisporula]